MTGRSLVQSPTERDVSECDREVSTVRGPRPPGGLLVGRLIVASSEFVMEALVIE